MKMPRKDWMPQNRAELCACISVLSLRGDLSQEDAQHVADFIAFRAKRGVPSSVVLAVDPSRSIPQAVAALALTPAVPLRERTP